MNLPVFFTSRMVAESGSFSPSAAKPAQVVASWRARGLPIEIFDPPPDVDDPLGGMMTTGELRRRDEIVFEILAELGIPIVWNLAGGYQRANDGSIPVVLEIHENTARAAIAISPPLRALAREQNQRLASARAVHAGTETRSTAAIRRRDPREPRAPDH
jgi:hypothetical protein